MKLTKTTALKASLLLVLAANVSWEQLDFGSTELASDSVPAAAGATSGTAAKVAAPTSKSGEGATVKLKAHTETAVSMKTQAREYKDDEPFMVCGDRYDVVFRQNDFTGGGETRITATKAATTTDGIAIIINAHMDATLAKKASSLETLKTMIKERRAQNNVPCAGEVVAGKKSETKTAEEIAKEADLKKQMHECKVDKKGESLKSDELTTCLNDELARVEERVPSRGADGKLVSDKKRNADILADAKALTKRLKERFRSALLSKDESRVDEAQAEVDKAIASLDSLKDSYDDSDDNDSDSRSSRRHSTRVSKRKTANPYEKMIAELSALSKAADVRLEALDRKAEAEVIAQNLKDGFRNAQLHPTDQQALNEYNQSKMEYLQFQYDLKNGFVNTDLNSLQQLRKNGSLSSGDYNDFVKPFNELLAIMKSSTLTPTATSGQNFSGPITNSTLGTDVPTNLAASRTTLSNNASSILGTPLPTVAPTVTPTMANGIVRPPVNSVNRAF